MFARIRARIRAAIDALSGRLVRRTIYDNRRTTLSSVTPAQIESALNLAANGDLRYLADIYDLMPATDGHLRGVRRQLKSGITSTPYEIVPIDETPEAAKCADLVTSAVENPDAPFSTLLEALIECELRGGGAVETLWPELGKGPRLWAGFNPVPQQRFRYDRNTGTPQIITDPTQPMGDPVTSFPSGKFIVLLADSSVPDFSARGGYRSILSDWFGRVSARYWLLQCLERFGMPIPLGKYVSDTDRQILETAFGSFGAAGSLLVSSSADVSFTAMPAITKLVHEDYMEASARRISVALLGEEQTATIGTDQGSRASATTHAQIRRDVLESLWSLLAATVRRDLFVPLIETNSAAGFGPALARKAPLLVPSFDEPADMLTTAQALDIVVSRLGIPVGVSHGQKLLGLPAPDPGESLLTPSEPTAPPLPSPGPGASPIPFPRLAAAKEQPKPPEGAPEGAGAEIVSYYGKQVDRVRSEADMRRLRDALASGREDAPPAPELTDSLAAVQMEAFLKAVEETRKRRAR